jgi:hypothetical protein
MDGTTGGVLYLLIGIVLIGIGVTLAYFGGKSVAAGEEGDININGQKVASSKAVPIIGLILGILLGLGGIGLVIYSIVLFTA